MFGPPSGLPVHRSRPPSRLSPPRGPASFEGPVPDGTTGTCLRCCPIRRSRAPRPHARRTLLARRSSSSQTRSKRTRVPGRRASEATSSTRIGISWPRNVRRPWAASGTYTTLASRTPPLPSASSPSPQGACRSRSPPDQGRTARPSGALPTRPRPGSMTGCDQEGRTMHPGTSDTPATTGESDLELLFRGRQPPATIAYARKKILAAARTAPARVRFGRVK